MAIIATGTSITPGQIPGTTTNDSAAGGNLGEYTESVIPSGSAVSLTSGTPANVTSLSLTAGDWDVRGAVLFNPAASTSMTASGSSLSLTSATLDAIYLQFDRYAAFVPANPLGGFSIGVRRVSVAVTTTVYLVAQATFTVSTLAAYGYLNARRVR